jgi:integrase
MPRLSKPLTDIQVRNAKPKATSYKLADSRGLHLLVLPSGNKHWRFRYRLAGKENMFAIGAYPDVNLASAREECERARKLVNEGIHPSHARQIERKTTATAAANTFQAIAEKWIDENKTKENQTGWTPYYCYQVEGTLANDVYPEIGALPIRQVTAAHILGIIKRVSTRKSRGGKVGAPTVALLIRQWCSAIFRHAVANLQADGDPAAALKGAVTRRKVQHKNALEGTALAEFVRKLESAPGVPQTHIALHLLLLTFVRPSELRCARWEEFDFENSLWTVPAERMKMREKHLVPLADQAVALLKRLRAIDGARPLLFPNVRAPNRPMSPTTLNRCLERMGYAGYFSAHGFRATASTNLNELGYDEKIVEIQLAHQERNKSKKAYNHAKYLPLRTSMMQDWADYIDAVVAGGNVVPFAKRLRTA